MFEKASNIVWWRYKGKKRFFVFQSDWTDYDLNHESSIDIFIDTMAEDLQLENNSYIEVKTSKDSKILEYKVSTHIEVEYFCIRNKFKGDKNV